MRAHQPLLQQIEFVHSLRLVRVSDQDLRGHQPPVAREKQSWRPRLNTARVFWLRFIRNWGCACVTEKGSLNPVSGKDPNRGLMVKGGDRHVWRSKRPEAVYPCRTGGPAASFGAQVGMWCTLPLEASLCSHGLGPIRLRSSLARGIGDLPDTVREALNILVLGVQSRLGSSMDISREEQSYGSNRY
jgi:hypothetical protein